MANHRCEQRRVGDARVPPRRPRDVDRCDAAVTRRVSRRRDGVAANDQDEGAKFTEYLKEEGLENIIAACQAAGASDRSAKERYARYAKIAIRNGSGDGTHLTRRTDLKAEFVPHTDPTSIRPGALLTVQFLTDGRPVADVAVSAVTQGAMIQGRTNDSGRVAFAIDREGAWLIKTVHVVGLPQTESSEADWESYWVTLSFYVAAH